MSLKVADIRRLSKMLGIRGAKSGLLDSDIDDDGMAVLAKAVHVKITSEANRERLVNAIVDQTVSEDLKPLPELFEMNFDELMSYFKNVKVSNLALMKLMQELNYKVSSEDKKHLKRHVARQIHETALFSKVAQRKEIG